MAVFEAKDFRDGRSGGTPLHSQALEDMQAHLSAYADAVAAGGIELGRANVTSFDDVDDTSYVDVPGSAVPVQTGGRPINVWLRADGASCAAPSFGGGFLLTEDGVDKGLIAAVITAAGLYISLASFRPLTPTPGEHTYALKAKTTNAANPLKALAGNGVGTNNSPLVLQVIQV